MPPAPGSQRSRVVVLREALHRGEGLAAVRRAKQRPGRGAEPELARLAPRLDVPRLLELEAGLLGQADVLRALPRLAHVGRALHGPAVRIRVGRRVERAVAAVDDRVEDVPAFERRPVELPRAPVVRVQLEEALPRADKQRHAHGRSLTYGPRMFDRLTELVSGAWWSYLVIFAVAYLDVIIPLVPSETLVVTAGVIASSGDLHLPLVILCGALGAFLGDNTVYFIGRRWGDSVKRRFFSSKKAKERLDWADRQLDERGGELIVVARFIPGGRTAVCLSAGGLADDRGAASRRSTRSPPSSGPPTRPCSATSAASSSRRRRGRASRSRCSSPSRSPAASSSCAG